MKIKFKYWTVTFKNGVITSEGQPHTNLKDAKAHMRSMHSSYAAVVKADKNEMPTSQVVCDMVKL